MLGPPHENGPARWKPPSPDREVSPSEMHSTPQGGVAEKAAANPDYERLLERTSDPRRVTVRLPHCRKCGETDPALFRSHSMQTCVRCRRRQVIAAQVYASRPLHLPECSLCTMMDAGVRSGVCPVCRHELPRLLLKLAKGLIAPSSVWQVDGRFDT